MKTNDLIAALVADHGKRCAPPQRTIAQAILIGGVVSAAAFVTTLGVRPDIAIALTDWRFDLKIALMLMAVGLAFRDCVQLANPAAVRSPDRSWIVVPILLGLAVALELMLVPADGWALRAAGSNARLCLTAIPALSIAPLVAMLLAMRSGAPLSPATAGLAAANLAAAVAATMYGLHCFDDSPLFVALWYPLAALPILAVGAWAGRRLLAW